ncbi:ScbA/BarX family gamma-butyrolactone biosynthesis protein [Streptomyces sp. NPDC048288]|uniref:ScbA/BarX family gamma-butyrolactone biosynthesis protein n=1 Tax=Streptomyces sp. NPDC048288 TaxID=3365529 RepID=UPI00371E1940
MQAIAVCHGSEQSSRPDETGISPEISLHPVPKELVHRSKSLDVLPVGWRLLTNDRYLISVEWPGDHPFYTTVNGNPAANLVAETVRQCGLLLAHAAYQAPLGHHFVMWDLAYTRERVGPAVTAGSRRIEVEAVCSDLRFRGPRLAAMTCEMTLRADGRTVARGGGRFDIVSPAVYRRLRGPQLASVVRPAVQPDPVTPALVGRTRPIDVVLAPAASGPTVTALAATAATAATAPSGRWQLRADFGHPTIFDHDNDHFPGMALVEAAFQAANAVVAPGRYHWSSTEVAFLGYVEFGSPCWIEARIGSRTGSRTGPMDATRPTAVEITGHQDGRPVFTALLEGTSAHG